MHNVSRGLSPRVRGNRTVAFGGDSTIRSIPACTGEPRGLCYSNLRQWVYPRVYGGTISLSILTMSSRGLSPRVRGNLGARSRRAKFARSIPACTGEPGQAPERFTRCKVYPRVYGGT